MKTTTRRVLLMPIKWPVILCLLLVLGLLFTLFYPRIENFLVFFPQASFDGVPEDYRLSYREVFFPTEDGERLHGWFFPLEAGGPVILFCHGNAGNISHRLDNVRRLLGEGLQVFIFDYRGYGRSSGRPSEQGLYRDGLAAWDHLTGKENVLPGDIVLFGRSLGAAVALEIALQRKVRALILEGAFTSTKDMARTMGPFSLIAPLLPAHYNNLEKIPRIGVPTLIIHGEIDEIVPPSMGRRLYEAAGDPKALYPVKGAGHNDTPFVGGEAYFQRIKMFLKDSGDQRKRPENVSG
ncbi:MAG: alpha/beta hydrolase [Deltaproteobacteria bacterium]|nr:alpha/beta hydrolase [Deltaproteobacteria bacterium]